MLYGDAARRIPQAMARCAPTAASSRRRGDGIAFLEAFMTGRLFPADVPRRDAGALEPGLPAARVRSRDHAVRAAALLHLFQRVPPMIGHSGASGAVLYCVPELDLYVSGTVNQVKKRSLSYNLMARLVMACRSAWRR